MKPYEGCAPVAYGRCLGNSRNGDTDAPTVATSSGHVDEIMGTSLLGIVC